MRRVVFLSVSFLTLSFALAFAQAPSKEPNVENSYEEYNPNSVNPIPLSHILIKNRIWRHIDLKEKQNKPFFPHKKELTKFIIEGVEEGALTPYHDEAFTQAMTQEEFFDKLRLPEVDSLPTEEKDLGFTDDDAWGEETHQESGTPKEKAAEYFLPNEISILELMEDWIFDKVRSVQLYDIQSLKLIIPADKFETGLRREIGIFKYKDLAAYFDAKELAWINVDNNAGNIKLAEAFDLRLFSSRIVKLENPDDNTVDDIYNSTPQAGVRASQELEEKLLEKEYFLWEH